ncbi:uncharacterized protein SETTUDRAFT_39106 [Exserohilum turcica Et28A]|uniref:Uncharacterized protein n=1 Tax=Exserohilum turcicum (strain 28A) TaxID=671987 RepID=R0KF91_EXST2|nr:uncharacterized protein SETTUDRAFT_39106 [Exserohilum turcica Et28A]EOA87984.1 hypothetical protein SETTUDRAFT_39106 [Exserohilum turcica Et28A]
MSQQQQSNPHNHPNEPEPSHQSTSLLRATSSPTATAMLRSTASPATRDFSTMCSKAVKRKTACHGPGYRTRTRNGYGNGKRCCISGAGILVHDDDGNDWDGDDEGENGDEDEDEEDVVRSGCYADADPNTDAGAKVNWYRDNDIQAGSGAHRKMQSRRYNIPCTYSDADAHGDGDGHGLNSGKGAEREEESGSASEEDIEEEEEEDDDDDDEDTDSEGDEFQAVYLAISRRA